MKIVKVITSVVIAASVVCSAVSGVLAETYIPGNSTDGVPGEFGSQTSTFSLNGSTYTNYQRGCTIVNSDGSWRDYGGANFTTAGALSVTLNNAGENMKNDIIGGSINDSQMDSFFGTDRTTYSDAYLKAKFQDAYEDLVQAGKAGGVPFEQASVWNGVVQYRLRFGDSTANIDDFHRSYMTDLVLGANKDKVYAVRDEFLQVYDPSVLGAPISNAGTMTINGKSVKAQLFANGYIVSSPTKTMTVNLKNNGTTILAYDIPQADIIVNMTLTAVSGQTATYTATPVAPSDLSTIIMFDANSGETYSDLTSDQQSIATQDALVAAFKAEYSKMIASGYSMGISSNQYIHWWAGAGAFDQDFYDTSDPANGYDGRVDTSLIYNPTDKAVYAVHGAILNKLTDGNESIGYPLGEQQTDTANNLIYQNFSGGYITVGSDGTVTLVNDAKYGDTSSNTTVDSDSSTSSDSSTGNDSSTSSDSSTGNDSSISSDSSTISDGSVTDSNTGTEDSTTGNVDTGDTAGTALPIAVLALAALGCLGAVVYRKNKLK